MLGVFNSSSDFHYSKPTPFAPALQAVGPAIRHILRHTRRSGHRTAARRHTTSMPVKCDGTPMGQLRIPELSELEWLMTTTPARANAPLTQAGIVVIGPCPAHMTGQL